MCCSVRISKIKFTFQICAFSNGPLSILDEYWTSGTFHMFKAPLTEAFGQFKLSVKFSSSFCFFLHIYRVQCVHLSIDWLFSSVQRHILIGIFMEFLAEPYQECNGKHHITKLSMEFIRTSRLRLTLLQFLPSRPFNRSKQRMLIVRSNQTRFEMHLDAMDALANDRKAIENDPRMACANDMMEIVSLVRVINAVLVQVISVTGSIRSML